MSAHNSFDIEQVGDAFRCLSHNFPDCVGEGETEAEAIKNMDRKIVYLADNYPEAYKEKIRSRLKKGFACDCGHKLDSPVLAVVGGPFL